MDLRTYYQPSGSLIYPADGEIVRGNQVHTFLLSALLFVSFVTLFSCGVNAPQGEGTANANINSSNDSSGDGNEVSANDVEQDDAGTRGVPVRVDKVIRRDISTGILSTSIVDAEQMVDIYSRVVGNVTSIEVEEGAAVKTGKLLCKLEDEELKLAEAKARANMEKLEKDLERIRHQVEKKVLAETDLINAEYAYSQARIEWEQKNTSLSYTEIHSTIDGIVSERIVRLGQKVDPSMKLYKLFNPKSLVVNIHVPENDYFNRVSGKEKEIGAVVTSESLPGMEFDGSIKRVAPVIDPQTNTIKITIQYQDPRNILLPGMYVRVKLITDTHEDAILVPKSAVIYDENRLYVFAVRNGVAKRILLAPGYEDTEYIECVEGLEVGEPIVVVGQTGLKDGTRVRIVEGETPGPESSISS